MLQFYKIIIITIVKWSIITSPNLRKTTSVKNLIVHITLQIAHLSDALMKTKCEVQAFNRKTKSYLKFSIQLIKQKGNVKDRGVEKKKKRQEWYK